MRKTLENKQVSTSHFGFDISVRHILPQKVRLCHQYAGFDPIRPSDRTWNSQRCTALCCIFSILEKSLSLCILIVGRSISRTLLA